MDFTKHMRRNTRLELSYLFLKDSVGFTALQRIITDKKHKFVNLVYYSNLKAYGGTVHIGVFTNLVYYPDCVLANTNYTDCLSQEWICRPNNSHPIFI